MTASPVISPAYQIKVTLRGTKPPIWRRILVRPELRLGTFHHVLGTAMGWLGGHLHEFVARGITWGPRNRFDDPWDDGAGPEDESKATVGDLFTGVKSKARYVYDFGDDWTHNLVLEKILPVAPMESIASCIGGARACPPEDCGGVWGYYDLLDALADPDHPDHKSALRWPGRFDPEAFSADAVNAMFTPLPKRKPNAKKKTAR